MTAAPSYLGFDPATRRLRLDPHEPAFVQDPYAAYRFLHEQGSTFTLWVGFQRCGPRGGSSFHVEREGRGQPLWGSHHGT